MAIQFARVELVGRASGGNACRKGSYNARTIIKDANTNITYNFTNRGDNVHHEILLPKNVDKKFQNVSLFMNEIERVETRKNSSLLKDIVIALPDDKELDLQDRINISHRIIDKMQWVQEGLGVQLDIHQPHDGEKNWHAHILLPKRRFAECGTRLGAKARDLDIQIRGGKNPFGISEEKMIHEKTRDVINDYFKELGLSNRVDAININPHEHIGPVRMRSVMNEAVLRNEEKREAEIEYLSSGSRVLEKVTKHMSVFTKGDLARAVKVMPDAKLRDNLVEDALSSDSLVSLYDESGKDTGYFTTTWIREEESKLLRLSSYVADSSNALSVKGELIAEQLIRESKSTLSEEQGNALSHLMLENKGLRILRGRAGVGKSYVLGALQKIASSAGLNVIGLAPTHKARGELASVGYEQNDTIKGMLFKLANGRFDLPKRSLIVVDEAGMVGNDDYKELLRVAASYKCNVILSGDEKQLASVQRGGMFEVFAEEYGSSAILNIQRQRDKWGKDVAMAFSSGEVRRAISILQDNRAISESATKNDSMQKLLADWDASKELCDNKLIIAVKNKDVTALNHGARQYLKLSGHLRGEEISVAGSHYMKGDRVLIRETDKKLGVVNGDLATIMKASKERFVLKMDNGNGVVSGINDNPKIVEFNPSEYSGFKHGYASTVFKAQGASIKDVFVFHDGFAGIRNSYVALSRHVNNLQIYINKQATRSINHLTKQLGHDPEIGSSVSYFSRADLANREQAARGAKERGVIGNILSNALGFTKSKITAFSDKHFVDSTYYQYQAPEIKKETVEEVLNIVATESSTEAIGYEVQIEEKKIVGGNQNITINALNKASDSSLQNQGRSRSKQTAKERFYAKVDHSQRGASRLARQEQWSQESEHLRSEVRFKTEEIARHLLGNPNKSLSDGRTLRFGDSGKMAVSISGERMGSWYDFSSGKGGDMFALVQSEREYDFKEAAEYLEEIVGIEKKGNSSLKLVYDHRNSDAIKDRVREKAKEARLVKAKEEFVAKLYARSKDIGGGSVAYRYLTKTRGVDLSSTGIASDIKTTGIYTSLDTETGKEGKYLPAIVAYARDVDNRVTGGQYILLDKKTNNKANIAVAKKSFGKISGSFVDLGQVQSKIANHDSTHDRTNNSKQSQSITIIAEGLETGLSVKQAMREHREYIGKNKLERQLKILCSLGISNIKNYAPSQGEKIIIAADNDGSGSMAEKTTQQAALSLQEKGAYVEVVRPNQEGIDFNDVLKSHGSAGISKSFESALIKHESITLKGYFGQDDLILKLDEQDKTNLAYIEIYNLSQEAIVDAYRKNNITGKLKLESTRKSLEMAINNLSKHQDIFDDAQQWGYKGGAVDMAKSLIGLNQSKSGDHINDIRNEYLANYLEKNLSKFRIKDYTYEIEDQKALITKEQSFLKETFELAKVSDDLTELYGDNQYIMLAGKVISQNPEKLSTLFKTYEKIQSDNIRTGRELCRDMTCSRNIDALIENANTTIERHHLKTIPAELAKAREKADSIDKAFIAIKEEQNQLADQHGKIQYLDFEAALLNKCELAHSQRENNSLSDLKDTVSQALEVGAKTEEELVFDLRQVTDLESAQKDLSSYIEERQLRRAVMIVQRDIHIVEKYEAQGKEQDVVRFLTEKKEEHADLKLKLQNSSEERSLDHLTNRLKIAEIYDHNKSIDVKLATQLKTEMLFMHRISRIGAQDAIKFSEEHGLEKSASFVQQQNIKYAVTELYKQSDILGTGKNQHGKDYIDSIAADKGLMRYVDEALSTLKKYNIDDNQKEVLLQYSNQRDIDVILKENKYQRSDIRLFNENVDNLHRFADARNLKEGLSILEKQGTRGLDNYTEAICTKNITESISKDCINIKRGRDVGLLDAEYSSKADYLDAISQDDTIMKYINLSLDKCRDTELKHDLLLCSNQHNIHKILESFKGSMSECNEFKDNIADIQRFGQVQDMSNILESYKSKGISAMTRHTSDICEHSITESISKDCINIKRGRDIGLLDDEYSSKADYLDAISQDDTIMKYINPRSETGQEIAKLQEVENVKTKDFDFEGAVWKN